MSATPAWEQSKENAAPLQRGRNVATLERATTRLGLQPRKDSSQEMIQHYENLVRPSEAPHVTEMDSGNDDPLEHWLAYIKFYQNTFPSDTHDQFLLMERCTRALVKMGQYADDDRFVGVCAKYADKTKDPAQVFKYLYTQKVGVSTALFFVAWAYVAEKDNDFQFAEQIFQKGIKKDAQPLQTLKARYQQFQRRMSRHWLNSSQRNDNDQLDEEEDEASTRSRAVFGGLSGDRARRNDRGAQRNQRSRGLGRQNVPSQHDSNGQSSTGFAIFTEEEGGEAGFLDQSLVENKRVIERHADRRKENAMDAERWNERGGLHTTTSNRILPTRSHTKGAPPAFNVFVDEECAAQHERETEERRSHNERQRRERDERTFRERSDEGLVSTMLLD